MDPANHLRDDIEYSSTNIIICDNYIVKIEKKWYIAIYTSVKIIEYVIPLPSSSRIYNRSTLESPIILTRTNLDFICQIVDKYNEIIQERIFIDGKMNGSFISIWEHIDKTY